ncbi:MAG: PKD domain-containing protein [Bacteroidales bacterium]
MQGSGGWVALLTNTINANVLPEGQHLVQNTGGIFHLAIMNGFPGAGQGGLYYGYYSDFGALNVGAVVAGTNSSVVRACYGDPVQLYAFGGTTYQWTPETYLDDPTSNMPTAINLPPGAHNYTVEVSGACGSGTVPLTVLVSSPVTAHFETNVTSGCSPLEIRFEDQSAGTYFWQYDLGDGTPLIRYDLDGSDNTYPEPPDPFTFTHTYTNTTDLPIDYQVTLLVKNSSGCADIVTRTITVFPEIHSDFSATPDEGCEPLEVQFTNNSWGNTDTWLWEFGDGGSSVEENPVHEFRNLFGPGNLVFDTRLIAISPYNCRDTSSYPITVNPYIEASFAYDTVAACSPHEIIITDQSIGADIYHWDFGDGTTSASAGPVISKVYENHTSFPVTYTIQLSVENNEGCVDTIEREVTVYPEVDADFMAHPAEACSPSEVIFQNNSTGADTYFWDFGDGGTSTGEHPIHRYERNMLDHDTVFTVTLVATSAEYCRDTARMDVVIHPYIEAAFTVEDIVGCHPFTITIQNESTGVDTYYWDFGDGTPVSNTDSASFTHTYVNPNDSTVTYPLELIVFNEEGCSDTLVRYITVHPEITANFSTDGLEGCHPLTVTFTDLSVNAVDYFWDFGDGAGSIEPSPVHTFTNFGTTDTSYLVTLTTSTADGECVKSISWPILVHPQAKADFSFEDALGCSPFEVTFENLSIGATEFTWDFGDGTVINTSDAGPVTHSFVNSDFMDSREFEVSLAATNQAGCNDEIRKKVTVYPAIVSDFTASATEGCHPLRVEFTNQSAGAGTYLWDFGDGSSSGTADPVHLFTNTGTVDSVYTVTLVTVAPNNFCRDTFSVDITVHPYVLANFTIPDPLGCSPFDVVLENSSVNATLFHWDFGDGTDTTTFSTDPLIHRFVNPDFDNRQDFQITLVAENFAGCTSEITRTVTVEPAIQAEFSASQMSGCHPLTVDFTNLSDGAAYYHWDFGNGTTSQETDPIQTFTNMGSSDTTYHVWLYATASNNVCRDSFLLDILVHPYIQAGFTFEEGIRCSPSSVTFNNASVGGTSFHWDFGDGTDTVTTDMYPVDHVFVNPSFTHNSSFQVVLTASNDAGCTSQITRTVEVYPAIEAAFTASMTEGCHPLEVDFGNLSRGGYTYSWDFGDGASSDEDSPDHTFTNFTDNPVTRQVRLVATSRFNCTREATVAITIHPKPKARFEIDRAIDCALFDVPIVNTSLRADRYYWDFGDGAMLDTSSMGPIHHVYDNLTDDIATYMLKLNAVSDYGCVDSSRQKIYVYPRTIADFTSNEEGCSPFEAHFINESVRGHTYQWDFGDGTSMSTTDPTNVYFNLTGRDTTYLVTLTSTSVHGCVDSLTDTVHVYAQPYAEFIASPTHQIYPSADVSITNVTNEGNWGYRWEMGDGSTSSLEDPPVHTYGEWGNYEITLHVASSHCADSVSHTVRIFPAPAVAEFDTLYPGCEPLTVQFTNRSLYGDSCRWDFDDGTTSAETEPVHTFEKYGLYNVKLTVFGEGGRDYAYRQVEVYRMPVVDFRVSPDLVMLPDQITKFFNLSKHGSSYLWDFGDGNASTDESPSHLYSNLGTFDITLDVWTEDGCTDRLVKPAAVTVIGEGEIYFPNAFKPDMSGPNGGYFDQTAPERNHIFHPLWEGVAEYHLEIYNRWGEQLFVSDDVNIGWDGYHNGTLCSQGVYVWKCSGTFVNGEYFIEVGDVTLLHHRR